MYESLRRELKVVVKNVWEDSRKNDRLNFSIPLLLAPFCDNRTAIEYFWEHSDILKNHNVNCDHPSCTIAAHRTWLIYSDVFWYSDRFCVRLRLRRYDLKNDYGVLIDCVLIHPEDYVQGGIWGRSQWGKSKAGTYVVSPTLPFPLSLPSPFPFPLSFQTNQRERRSDPVRGKFPAFPPTNTTLITYAESQCIKTSLRRGNKRLRLLTYNICHLLRSWCYSIK